MPFQTWVARFVVDHGRVTEEGGLLRTFPRRRLDEPDADLHIIAEPRGEKGNDLGAQAIENVGKLFLEDRLSLTGGVMRALKATHHTLLDWNRRSIPREQVTSGFAAALVSGTLVYLFQGGPGLCFFGRDGRLQRLAVEPENAAPLGEGDLEPALRRFEMTAGDLILAASESLLSLIDEAGLEQLLRKGTEEALPELYLLTKDLPDFALMAITCIDAPEPEQEPPPPEQEVLVAGRGAAQQEPREVSREAPDFFSSPPEAPRDESDDAARPLVPPPPVDISRPLVRLRGDQASNRNDYARTTGPPAGFRLDLSQPRLIAIAGAVALILFVGAFAVPDLIRENRGEKISGLLQNAQVQLASGAAENDPARKRTLLEGASTLTAEILRLDPAHAEATSIRQQALAALTLLTANFDLGPMTTVTTFSQRVTGEVSLDAMTIAGGVAYILDSKGGRVLSMPLDNSTGPVLLYEDGATYAGTPARKPQFLVWEGTETEGRLLVLDAERKLFAVRPGAAPAPLPLRRTNTWASVAGIASYDGNLYVLDASGNKVHRYRPAANGFDSEPESILSGQVDFKDAVGIAVDGDIFVLKRTGEVLRFSEGAAAPFTLGGIDRPLTGPNAIRVVSIAAEVYISDAGNKRVVVAAKDGSFRRQFTSSAFTDIRAMGVDPIAGQLYVIVGDQLLTAPIVR